MKFHFDIITAYGVMLWTKAAYKDEQRVITQNKASVVTALVQRIFL